MKETIYFYCDGEKISQIYHGIVPHEGSYVVISGKRYYVENVVYFVEKNITSVEVYVKKASIHAK